jgi:hypothetical protein
MELTPTRINWDLLNWVQLPNAKYNNFFLPTKQREKRKRKLQGTIHCYPCNNLPGKKRKEHIVTNFTNQRMCSNSFLDSSPFVSCRLSADTRSQAFVPITLDLVSSTIVYWNCFLNLNWDR